MTMTWPRVMPALVTAFTDDGDLDLDAHVGNVGVAVEAGAHGVLIGGSTGEGPYLERGERSKLVQITTQAFPNLTVVSGIFAESTRQAERQICEVADAGAHALLVVTPTTLVRGRREWIVDYFESLADSSPLPVFLYTVPTVTGYELPCESVAELAGHHNIIGMKDSGGDTSRLDAIARIMDDSFIVYAGSSRVLLDSVDRGAYGAIAASANYAFDTVSRTIEGDTAAQDRLKQIISVVEPHGVPGTKFAASLVGMSPGPGRSPLRPLNAATQEAIRTVIAQEA